MANSKFNTEARSYKAALGSDPGPILFGSGYGAGPILVTPDLEKSSIDPGMVPEAAEIDSFDVGGVEESKCDDHNLGGNLGEDFIQGSKKESVVGEISMAEFEPTTLGINYQPEVTSAAGGADAPSLESGFIKSAFSPGCSASYASLNDADFLTEVSAVEEEW